MTVFPVVVVAVVRTSTQELERELLDRVNPQEPHAAPVGGVVEDRSRGRYVAAASGHRGVAPVAETEVHSPGEQPLRLGAFEDLWRGVVSEVGDAAADRESGSPIQRVFERA